MINSLSEDVWTWADVGGWRLELGIHISITWKSKFLNLTDYKKIYKHIKFYY